MKYLAAALVALTAIAQAAEPQIVPLWPGAAPGSEGWTWNEERTLSPLDHTVGIRNVVDPALAVHLPAPGTATGTAVLVVPGGGFVNLAYGKEGDTIAEWLNSLGIAAFVLKYRVAHTDAATASNAERGEARKVIPLATADARQAMQIVRTRAAEWGVRPDRIGAIGFSAGGYLVLALGADPDEATRPDFVAAIYAAAPRDLEAPAGAPPLFMAVAADDPHVPNDSFAAFDTWRKAGASVELHVYAKGGHGFALRKQGLPVDSWNERFVDWMKWNQLLP